MIRATGFVPRAMMISSPASARAIGLGSWAAAALRLNIGIGGNCPVLRAKSRPARRRGAERLGGLGEIGRSLAEVSDGFEMVQVAERAVAFDEIAGKFGF